MTLLKNLFTFFTLLGSVYFLLPLIVLLYFVDSSLGLSLFIGFFFIYAVVVVVRLVYYKERPLRRSSLTLFQKIHAASFPSMHAARALFVALILLEYFAVLWVTLFLLILALLIAYSRVFLRHHYWIDVLFGWLLGCVIWLLMKFFLPI